MKQIAILILLFLAVLPTARGSHAVGGEITYEYLDSNAYRIKTVFYRNCSGVAAPSTVVVNADNACGYSNTVVFLSMMAVEDISLVCRGTSSFCNGGSYRGYQRYTYTGIVHLPGPCSRWTFSYTEASRSTEITTINPNQNLYVSTDLNNQLFHHSSPQFTPTNIPETCTNQSFCMANIATSVNDSDVLVYHLIAPLKSPASEVNYRSSYSASQPVRGTITIDSITGNICILPTTSEAGVFAIEIKQYRYGMQIGRVVRDLILVVNVCSNQLPVIGEFSSGADTAIACKGISNCFSIGSDDADGDSTFIESGTTLPFALAHAGSNDEVSFCWTPTAADLSSSPFNFLLNIRDNACPFNGYQSKAFTIVVYDTTDTYCQLILSENKLPTESIRIYPNPATDRLNISSPELIDQIHIFSFSGNLLKSEILNSKNTSLEIQLPNGIYFASLLINGKQVYRKVVISH